MTLTEDEIAYRDQKNREFIYEECKERSFELFGFYNWEYIDALYEYECKLTNINPWNKGKYDNS